MLRYEQRTTTMRREIDTCYVRLISVRLLISIVHIAKCLPMIYRHPQHFYGYLYNAHTRYFWAKYSQFNI